MHINRKVWIISPLIFIIDVIMLIMTFISFFYDEKVFLFELSISVLLLIMSIIGSVKSNYYINAVINGMNKSLTNSRGIIDNINIPVLIIYKNNDVVYYNSVFKENFNIERSIIGESLIQFINEDQLNEMTLNGTVNVSYGNRNYKIYATLQNKLYFIYFIDNTEYIRLKNDTDSKKPVVMSIVFDNIEEFLPNNRDRQSLKVLLEVDSVVSNWVTTNNGLFEKLSESKYMAIFEDKIIDSFIESKFDILDNVKNIKTEDGKYATISIGVGRYGKDLKESELLANNALDMALGRGGDQVAIIQENGMYNFFGGILETSVKKSKVRARIIAYKILDYINMSNKVIIMGHKYSDLDSVGSSLGMYGVIEKFCQKDAYIAINRSETAAESLICDIESKYSKSPFISQQIAEELIDKETLIMIMDTHSKSFLESDRIYELANKVVVIDHHRLTMDYIDDAVVFYHEPSASSTSEMVTELIQYMASSLTDKVQAKALLAGIMLDTKNFIIKTSARTFEAAAYLRLKGADTIAVKKLFADPMNAYKLKCKLMSQVEVYNNCAVVCATESIEDDINMKIICSQVADDLLSIDNIVASFVIYDNFGSINVSARSLGEINVQLIMESMGGGGHQSMAGTQIKNKSILDVKNNIIEILNNMKNEEHD